MKNQIISYKSRPTTRDECKGHVYDAPTRVALALNETLRKKVSRINRLQQLACGMTGARADVAEPLNHERT